MRLGNGAREVAPIASLDSHIAEPLELGDEILARAIPRDRLKAVRHALRALNEQAPPIGRVKDSGAEIGEACRLKACALHRLKLGFDKEPVLVRIEESVEFEGHDGWLSSMDAISFLLMSWKRRA